MEELLSVEPRVATVTYECTAMASHCINEFPGDWNWSCGGLVKLGFRNPSFGSAVCWFPAVNTAATAVRGCPTVSTGQPQTCRPLALHSPRPGASRLADYYDPSSWTFWVSWTRFVLMNKTLLGEWGKSKQKQKRKKNFLCLVGANQYFIFHGENRIWA